MNLIVTIHHDMQRAHDASKRLDYTRWRSAQESAVRTPLLTNANACVGPSVRPVVQLISR